VISENGTTGSPPRNRRWIRWPPLVVAIVGAIALVVIFVGVVTVAGMLSLGEDICITQTSWGEREDNGLLESSRTLFWPSVTCSWTTHDGVAHEERISFGS